jgi:hypothetical protein
MGNGASAEGDASSGAVASESGSESAIGSAAVLRSGALASYLGPDGQLHQPIFRQQHVPIGGLQQSHPRRPPRLEQIEAFAGGSAAVTSPSLGKRMKKKKKKKKMDQSADDDGDDDGGGPSLSTRGMAQRRRQMRQGDGGGGEDVNGGGESGGVFSPNRARLESLRERRIAHGAGSEQFSVEQTEVRAPAPAPAPARACVCVRCLCAPFGGVGGSLPRAASSRVEYRAAARLSLPCRPHEY